MRIALPKGRLWPQASALLKASGIDLTFLEGGRDYSPLSADPRVRAKVVKTRAIPQLVALGNFDAGFCGLDLVREAGYEEVVPFADLGLNGVQIVVAAPRSSAWILENPPKRPIVIATEYLRLADEWAMRNNLAHITIQTWGSTEGYAPEDADLVFDCVETGKTLEANGLVILEKLFSSTTYFVVNRSVLDSPTGGAELRYFSEKFLKSAKEIAHA